jgi:hypothetical protein
VRGEINVLYQVTTQEKDPQVLDPATEEAM